MGNVTPPPPFPGPGTPDTRSTKENALPNTDMSMHPSGPRCSSHHLAAAVCFAGLLVEHLARQTEVAAFVHEVLQLLPAFQHALDCFVENHLGLIQVPLDLRQLVSLSRILWQVNRCWWTDPHKHRRHSARGRERRERETRVERERETEREGGWGEDMSGPWHLQIAQEDFNHVTEDAVHLFIQYNLIGLTLLV
jgi:hypothetical protein